MTSTCNCPIDLCQLSFPAFSSPEPLGLICNERPRDQETTGSGDENGFPPHWTPSLKTPLINEASENPEVNPEVECKAVLSGKGVYLTSIVMRYLLQVKDTAFYIYVQFVNRILLFFVKICLSLRMYIFLASE